MKTEAWWVCNVCRKPVQKVGRGGGALKSESGHRKECPKATYSMKQLDQRSGTR